MKRVAIITARGGSKRIPGKNIKSFCGKPILAYSIEAAKNSGMFDEIMVSTDSKEIADVAVSFGAKVPFMRSEKTSDDYSTTDDVLREVLDKYCDMGVSFDEIACLYPTAPFITKEKIINAIELLENTNADEVLPVVAYSFPPQRANVIRDGMLKYQYPENIYIRSQDLETIYHDCGQFDIMKVESLYIDVEYRKVVPFILPELEVQDIDNESDWMIAEIKFKLMSERK